MVRTANVTTTTALLLFRYTLPKRFTKVAETISGIEKQNDFCIRLPHPSHSYLQF